MECVAPPEAANAKYTSSEAYPIGTDVEYQCISRFVNNGMNNTNLICATLDNQQAIWVGEEIKCQISAETGECD